MYILHKIDYCIGIFIVCKGTLYEADLYYHRHSMKHTDTPLGQVNQNIEPKRPNGCEECIQMGSDWVHLLLSLTCGHVGCCDSSPNKHATKHFRATEHPIIRSFEPGEDCERCYLDNTFIE